MFFPPLAWQLVHQKGAETLDRAGWADVTGWCVLPAAEHHYLDDPVPALPAVVYPRHQAGGDVHRFDLFEEEKCPMIECLDVLDPHSIESTWRRKHVDRISVPTETFMGHAASIARNQVAGN
ncbi:hypothetical protein [Nocardia tengchongensis]|uniref:hypothetical protein n=1 Tax=Nocardia tengchongensis TaxID=2055889 RepID=UPI003614C530